MMNSEEYGEYLIRCRNGKIILPEELLIYLNNNYAIVMKDFMKNGIALFSEDNWNIYITKITSNLDAFKYEHNYFIRELSRNTFNREICNGNLIIPRKLLNEYTPKPNIFRLLNLKDKINSYLNISAYYFFLEPYYDKN